jgi:hypothetical protein
MEENSRTQDGDAGKCASIDGNSLRQSASGNAMEGSFGAGLSPCKMMEAGAAKYWLNDQRDANEEYCQRLKAT